MAKVDSSSWGYKKPTTKVEKSAMQADRLAWVRSWATGKNIPADYVAAHNLARTAAPQMKRAGLYSSKTYDYDIASSILSTLENLGIRKRYPQLDEPSPEVTRRDEYAPLAMTMRDYFAAKAMQAIVGHTHGYETASPPDIARGAYAMADAMEAARKGGGGG